jgi:formate hydrogenlyase subunit 6/NADH:ubiquinone oxidoreductase subunit I
MPIKFRKALCVECNSCVEECPPKAISISEEVDLTIDLKKCNECMKCIETCPTMALYKAEEET